MALTSGTYSNVETEIYGYLTASGFSTAVATGILANIEKESGFNPNAYNASEGAYGLCQWRLSRKTALYETYGTNPSVRDQVNFIIDELHSTYSGAYSKLQGISNTQEGAAIAANNFAQFYERCDESLYNARVERSEDYWDYYNGSTVNASTNIALTPNSVKSTTPGVSTSPGVISVPWDTSDYSGQIAQNLSEVQASGFDAGYLKDLTRGGSFRFYIPEFTESAGTNWTPINIPGRSVQILSYESTNSRKITISLDLYAGVGMYSGSAGESGEAVVSRMHSDANFVKSLEYPEYQDAFVIPPSTVHLILGSAVNMIGVVSDVSVEHLKPLDEQNRSMYIKLSFTVTQVAENPPDCYNIREGISALYTSSGRGGAQITSSTPTSLNIRDQGYIGSYEPVKNVRDQGYTGSH